MQTDAPLKSINPILQSRILIMDGPMATMLGLPTTSPLGAPPCDLLNLSEPERVRRLHGLYLDSGADILRTNTFNSNAISLPDLPPEVIHKLNVAGVEIARTVLASAGRKCLLAGVLGPTSLSPEALPNASLVNVFHAQSAALMGAGVDLLIAETITYPKSIVAFLEAVERLSDERSAWVPAVVSVAPVGKASLAAFLETLTRYKLMAIGLNCVSPADMEPALAFLAENTELPLCVYPNAGLPDSSHRYPDKTREIALALGRFASRGMVNIVGGCCGTSPDLTRTLARTLEGVSPRGIRGDYGGGY